MDTTRYELVDSLYGPGTVSAWLLTLIAVLISWTLNPSSRRKDTISVDFLGALLLPTVAAGHLVFQLSRLPFSVAQTLTAADMAVQQYASAIEAPLNVCETFSIVALVLVVCCGPWWDGDGDEDDGNSRTTRWKRVGLVLVVGLLSWGMENVMFAMGTLRGVRFVDATLSRPYLFFLTPVVGVTWGFLIICILVGGVTWFFGRPDVSRARPSIEKDVDMKRRGWARRSSLQTLESSSGMESMKERWHRIRQESRTAERSTQMMTLVTLFFLPVAFSTSFLGLYSLYLLAAPTRTYPTHFFLIPKSNGSMASLDQILALVGGLIVLLSAIHRAYRSRVDRDQSKEKIVYRRRSL